LPEKDKEKFKEEFWKKRDPDRSTEENEFKMTYFDRIEQANELFRSEGREGWRTDRGRIYVLYGPPRERLSNPTASRECVEVWYYGNYPVEFYDWNCSGSFRLTTFDLSPLRDLNIKYMYRQTQEYTETQKALKEKSKFFNFDWNIDKTLMEENLIQGKIRIEVPYSVIWFAKKGAKLLTTIKLTLELKDEKGVMLWKYEEDFKVETDEKDLVDKKNQKFEIEVPFSLEEGLDKIRQEKAKLTAVLKNTTGGDEQRKVQVF
jgi:GWxTD domain-containing protein